MFPLPHPPVLPVCHQPNLTYHSNVIREETFAPHTQMVHLQEEMFYCRLLFAVAGGEAELPTVQSSMLILSGDPRSQVTLS